MKQLETKYTTAMRDKADLTDSKEQLEHLIMQLQGETETIGKKATTFQTYTVQDFLQSWAAFERILISVT